MSLPSRQYVSSYIIESMNLWNHKFAFYFLKKLNFINFVNS